jgi:hypothetical protein
LFCGGKELVQGLVPGIGGVEGGIWDEGREGLEEGWGREIEVVPMCEMCLLEIEVQYGNDGLEKGRLVDRAVERVKAINGGLERERWERRQRGRLGEVRSLWSY